MADMFATQERVRTRADLPAALVLGRKYFVEDEGVVVIDWGEGTREFGAGLADAPSDGKLYGRRDGTWEEAAAEIVDALGGGETDRGPSVRAVDEGLAAKADKTELAATEARLAQDIAAIQTGGGGITDAPSDGKLYGRKDGAWGEVTIPTQAAPVDALSGNETDKAPSVRAVNAGLGTKPTLSASGKLDPSVIPDVARTDMFYRGAYPDGAALVAAHQTDVAGAYATVLATTSMWIWDGTQWADTGTPPTHPVTVVDGLVSTSIGDALSANQGRVLDEKKADKTELANALATKADKSELTAAVADLERDIAAISGGGGAVVSVVDALGGGETDKAPSVRAVDAALAAIPAPVGVVDALDSTSTTDALSAGQGRILKAGLDAKPGQADVDAAIAAAIAALPSGGGGGDLPFFDLGLVPLSVDATVPATTSELCLIRRLGVFRFEPTATNVTDGETCIKGHGGTGRWKLQVPTYDLGRRNEGRMTDLNTEALRVYDHIMRSPAGAADLDVASTLEPDRTGLAVAMSYVSSIANMCDDYGREEQLFSHPGTVRTCAGQPEWINAMMKGSWGSSSYPSAIPQNNPCNYHFYHRLATLLNDQDAFEATLGSQTFWAKAANVREYYDGFTDAPNKSYPPYTYTADGIVKTQRLYEAVTLAPAAMEAIYATSTTLGTNLLQNADPCRCIASSPERLALLLSSAYGPTLYRNFGNNIVKHGGDAFLRLLCSDAGTRARHFGAGIHGEGYSSYARNVYTQLTALGWTKKDFKYVSLCTDQLGDKTAGWSGPGLAFVSIRASGTAHNSVRSGITIDGRTCAASMVGYPASGAIPSMSAAVLSTSYVMAPADGWSVWVESVNTATTVQWCAELWTPPAQP
ncbi:MAG: hypothetical protein IJR14_08710 [Synergistaceae bacterium]|nr:hypothetical protein [Synergistaceae bacterium]